MTASIVDSLINYVSQLGSWGYLIIFLGATLESSAFLGIFVPGETLVLLGGFLVSNGTLDLLTLMGVVCAGAIIGDSIGYELGRHLGRPWILHYGRWLGVRPKHLDRASGFFESHGGKTVLIGRFVGFLRALAPFVAGASGMRYRRFLLYNAVGAVLWSVSFVLLGYAVGVSWRVAEKWVSRIGAVGGGVLAAVILLWVLWAWLGRREEALKRRWRALTRPLVSVARRLFFPVRLFLEARLRPKGRLGLYLTLGALVLIGTTWLFAAITHSVLIGGRIIALDRRAATALHEQATPGWTAVLKVVTYLGSMWLVGPLAFLSAALLALYRQRYRVLVLALAVPGGVFINWAVKQLVHRPRPQLDHPLLEFSGYSFPSSHTTASVLLYGTLAAFAVRSLTTWRWKVGVVLLACFLVALIGFTRLYLGAHYLSDVLGAAALGLFWITLCLTSVEMLRRHSGEASRTSGVTPRGAAPAAQPAPSETPPAPAAPPAAPAPGKRPGLAGA